LGSTASLSALWHLTTRSRRTATPPL